MSVVSEAVGLLSVLVFAFLCDGCRLWAPSVRGLEREGWLARATRGVSAEVRARERTAAVLAADDRGRPSCLN
jgi:hypothetical protein